MVIFVISAAGRNPLKMLLSRLSLGMTNAQVPGNITKLSFLIEKLSIKTDNVVKYTEYRLALHKINI